MICEKGEKGKKKKERKEENQDDKEKVDVAMKQKEVMIPDI
jgi:hypothetical protein